MRNEKKCDRSREIAEAYAPENFGEVLEAMNLASRWTKGMWEAFMGLEAETLDTIKPEEYEKLEASLYLVADFIVGVHQHFAETAKKKRRKA